MRDFRSFLLVAVTVFGIVSCNEPQDHLKGQSNARLTFYGLAIDQAGQPLQGVQVRYRSEAFPANWTFKTRGEPHTISEVEATTDEQGRFEFTIETHILKRLSVSGPSGYRHFYEEFVGGTSAGGVIPSTYGYLVISWSEVQYKSDPERPAIFVFVKDGVKEVSALPSRGGYQVYGKDWIPNEPKWPRKPSLKDVAYVPPATQPSTALSTMPAGAEGE